MIARSIIGHLGRLQPSEAVHCRQFDDEVLLLDLATGQYFSLNAVGAKMWNALIAGKTPVEVAELLAPDYDVSEDVLTQDCVELANELLGRGMLRAKE